MKVRSITFFCQPGYPPNRLLLEHVGIAARHARSLLENEGIEVQSCRLATPPFPRFLQPETRTNAVARLAVETHAEGFEYLSFGPALPSNLADYHAIPGLIATSGNVFFSGKLTTDQAEVSLPAVKACAEVIADLAMVEPGGFANLRFCALANVPPFAPFFPAAYGEPDTPSLAFAIEGADLAVEAFGSAGSLLQARQNLLERIQKAVERLVNAGEKIAQIYRYPFKGLDFTLAPYPEQSRSIAVALESLGLNAFGDSGSLAACAFLTDTLDQARYPRVGFNGLMLPVLEDSGLAARAMDGSVSVRDLLLYSSVCGTGLDVIPIPGDSGPDEIYPVLLDLAALSLRLKKPLTARLMPIPGKVAGDLTEFNFEFFQNTRVLPLRSKALKGLLAGNENIAIGSRYENSGAQAG